MNYVAFTSPRVPLEPVPEDKRIAVGLEPADYRVYIALVNREDLLQRALIHSGDVMDKLTVIDNSKDGMSFNPGCRIYRSPTPIQFVHSINYALLDSRRQGAKICMWLHCDAWTPDGAYTRLIEEARKFTAEGRKWGCLFTNYDALLAMNTDMIEDVGLWDENLSWYHSDEEFYYRVKLNRYELIDTCIEVFHDYSQTIKSDPKIKFINDIMQPLGLQYFRRKWGGPPHHEAYTTPFGKEGHYE